jgi:hypothetical protein
MANLHRRYFELDDEFGKGRPNRRADGIKLETILGNSGDMDMERVGGPTGFGYEQIDKGLRAYQKRNGLKVDGWARPGGPSWCEPWPTPTRSPPTTCSRRPTRRGP